MPKSTPQIKPIMIASAVVESLVTAILAARLVRKNSSTTAAGFVHTLKLRVQVRCS